MADINIQMNMKNSSGTYDVLYPATLGSQVSGAVSSASTLATGRTIRTNLDSTSTASFDGSANITPGVSGTLPLGNGGTNGTTASTGLYNLISGCSTRSASLVNSYASSTYLAGYYSSTGYRIAISNLLTYFQNNISSNAGLTAKTGSYTGTGSSSTIIVSGISTLYFVVADTWSNSGTAFQGTTYYSGMAIGFNNNNTGAQFVNDTTFAKGNSYMDSRSASVTISGNTFKIGSTMQLFRLSGSIVYWMAIGM